MKTKLLIILLFLIVTSTGIVANSFAETTHATGEYELIVDDIVSIDDELFFISPPYQIADEPNKITTFHGVNFTIPYIPSPTSPGGIRSTTITFSDGKVESLSRGVSPYIETSFIERFGLKAGFSRHPDNTFFFLVSINSEPPLKQFKSGIAINEIQCKENLEKLMKHDGSPVCIKPESVQKLLNHGFMHVPIGASFHVEKDCNDMDARKEAQCFKDAFETCTFAQSNDVIYTIEGDAMYLEAIIKADCKIHITFDNSGDRFGGPTKGVTNDICNDVELQEKYIWIIGNCSRAEQSEFQINYQAQDFASDEKCRSMDGEWNYEFHNCEGLPDDGRCQLEGGEPICMSTEQTGSLRMACYHACEFTPIDRK